MTVMFMDIHTKVAHKIWGKNVDIFKYWEILYADDTMLMGKRAREINIILAEIETESAKYGLKLNKSKCFYIGMNGKANIHFKDNTPIKQVHEVTYLEAPSQRTLAEMLRSLQEFQRP